MDWEKVDWKSEGIDIAELCVMTKLSKSRSEARRMVQQGAVRVDDFRITDPHARVAWHPDNGRYYVIETIKDR